MSKAEDSARLALKRAQDRVAKYEARKQRQKAIDDAKKALEKARKG